MTKPNAPATTSSARSAFVPVPANSGPAHSEATDRWTFDLSLRRVFRNGRPIPATLTPREWHVAEALARRAGTVCSEAELEAVMSSAGKAVTRNAIRIHLSNIRRKLGRESIQTLPGQGYRVPLAVRLIES
jgi:two-component system OmpR family response regulator